MNNQDDNVSEQEVHSVKLKQYNSGRGYPVEPVYSVDNGECEENSDTESTDTEDPENRRIASDYTAFRVYSDRGVKASEAQANNVASLVSQPSPIDTNMSEIDDIIPNKGEECFDIKTGKSYRENAIDSKTIGNKTTKLMKLISDENTSITGKIKIADYLCDKLCDIYRLSLEKHEVICKNLQQAVYDGDNIPIPLRLRYMRFRNETVPYPVSIWLYGNGISKKLQTVPYFQILKYILHSYLVDEETTTKILTEFEELFTDENTSEYTKMEIADIFLLNNRKERGEEMLNVLRTRGLRLELGNTETPDAMRMQRLITVYGDSQNVHSHDMNDSVLSACVHLIGLIEETDFDPEEVRSELMRVAPSYKEQIDIVLERIQIDTSRFTYKSDRFGLLSVFSCLWTYIKRHPSKDELLLRLVEEIDAMARYCTTGHVSRFINVIQGYTNDEKLQVRISDKEQIKSVVAHYLNTVCEKAGDEVLDAMMGGDQTPFYKFVETKMNDRIPKIVEEYGDVQEHIVEAIKSYTKWDNWSLMDNRLTVTGVHNSLKKEPEVELNEDIGSKDSECYTQKMCIIV